jgi:riboflavin biosynthesis pyrimidine reductase
LRQLLPVPIDDVDVAEVYASDERAPHADGRPWVLVNMVASIDGATTVGGVSGPLGGPGDREVFRAIRAVADTILVAAGTVRAEDYGPPGGGQRLAVLTGSADLDPDARLFAGGVRPLVLTTAAAPAARVDALRAVAEVVEVGASTVAPEDAFEELRLRGARVVLCEGGPSLNGQLIRSGIVDEWCQTVAPTLAGGPAKRPAVEEHAPPAPIDLQLDRLLVHQDGTMFARYLRA